MPYPMRKRRHVRLHTQAARAHLGCVHACRTNGASVAPFPRARTSRRRSCMCIYICVYMCAEQIGVISDPDDEKEIFA